METPELTLLPGLSNERELQLLRLGINSGRGLSAEDSVRLAGELPIRELKKRAGKYLEECPLENKAATAREKGEALRKFFWYHETTGAPPCSEKEIRGFLNHVKNGHLQPGDRWGLADILRHRGATGAKRVTRSV